MGVEEYVDAKPVPISLRAHLLTSGVEDDELRRMIDYLTQTSKYVSDEIRKSEGKLAGTRNVYGEEQLALDVLADKLILQHLREDPSFKVREFVSEESDNIVTLDTDDGRYSIAVDPLDGSSLVDVNLSIGTIVSIHDGEIMSGKTGRDSIVAAMFILYGPKTTMVYSAGKGAYAFEQDSAGNFVMSTHGKLEMKSKGRIYSPGGLKKNWLPGHRDFIDTLEEEGHKLRYSGAFVAEMNQLLIKKGGVFSYPALTDAPNGKLRLLFELQPMAYIMEQAGGAATDGTAPILDLVPHDIDQRCPIYIGSSWEVALARSYIRKLG